MDGGSAEAEGVAAQCGHCVAVHIDLILMIAVNTELVTPCVGGDVLTEADGDELLVVAQCLIVHKGDRVGHGYLGELGLIDSLVAKLGDALGQGQGGDGREVEGIVADAGHVVGVSLDGDGGGDGDGARVGAGIAR